MGKLQSAHQLHTAHLGHAGDAIRDQSAALGLDENQVTGEYTPGDQIDDPDDTFMPRFLYAFWRLCDQQIATIDHTPVNHSTQLLAQRAGVSPDVRVVHLRRTQPAEGLIATSVLAGERGPDARLNSARSQGLPL